MLPDDHPYMIDSNAWYEIFPVENALILSISTDSELFTTSNLMKVKKMSEELQQSPLINTVYSITQLADSDERTFTEKPFMEIQDEFSIAQARASLERINILKSLFLSRDGQALLLYVIPKQNVEASLIGNYLDEFKRHWSQEAFSISISGLMYQEYQNRENVIADLIRISLLGLLMLGLVYYFFIRSIPISAILLINSFLPSLIMFGLLSISKTPIDLMTVLLPLLLFSIGTAYSIHYCKSFQRTGNRLQTLMLVGQIIFLSAVTTMLGYSNLLFLNSKSMKTLGLSLLLGILLSVFSILFCLPIILEHCSFKQYSTWELKIHASGYPKGKNRLMILLSYSLVLLFASCGIYWYTGNWYYKDGYHQDLRSFVPMEREIEAFAKHNGRLQSMELFIDTNKEYGLIKAETYSQIDTLTRDIRALDSVASIISYTDITAYGNGILYGQHAEIPPQNEAEIGETLELVGAYREDLPLRLFVDHSYEKTRLLIHYDDSQAKTGHEKVLIYLQILEIVEQSVSQIENATYHTAGKPLLLKALNAFFLDFLSQAAPLFFLSIFVFGLIVLKSLQKSFMLLLPSFFASCLFIGLNAWFKQPISIFNL
ncbi:MAG: hypothetical protein EOM15_02250, partial [Spirochaetia bacterium]|nr:hypothetical protein [Spirochaetia bacterium]